MELRAALPAPLRSRARRRTCRSGVRTPHVRRPRPHACCGGSTRLGRCTSRLGTPPRPGNGPARTRATACRTAKRTRTCKAGQLAATCLQVCPLPRPPRNARASHVKLSCNTVVAVLPFRRPHRRRRRRTPPLAPNHRLLSTHPPPLGPPTPFSVTAASIWRCRHRDAELRWAQPLRPTVEAHQRLPRPGFLHQPKQVGPLGTPGLSFDRVRHPNGRQ
jgi:hypothetical protein